MPTASADVRDFYERLPYPAPVNSLDEHRELYKNPLRRRAMFHLMFPAAPPAAHQEILVAGCGTSQAARYALREPESRITAIDISETSLRHTSDLRDKYRLQNLDLHRLAIEDVRDLDRKFDQIICTGVLHHLPDPDLGLRALGDVLRPNGAMHLMVYAPYGRAGIYMMQEYCRLLGITPSSAELRDLAGALNALPSTHPIVEVIRRARDFHHAGALADALLHPVDRAYSVPQLFDWLGRCGMSFGRWIYQAPYLAQCGTLAKTTHAARLASLPAPQQYAAAELFRGSMVTHAFIAYRAGESPSFTISANMIPIPLPWTVCVREHQPPGSVAVLINRAHTFTDLVLPINAAQDRLLSLADGNRTLAQIIQMSREDGQRALDFFEQLWRYDQVVFDASRA